MQSVLRKKLFLITWNFPWRLPDTAILITNVCKVDSTYWNTLLCTGRWNKFLSKPFAGGGGGSDHSGRWILIPMVKLEWKGLINYDTWRIGLYLQYASVYSKFRGCTITVVNTNFQKTFKLAVLSTPYDAAQIKK